jgi:hypothetical protein
MSSAPKHKNENNVLLGTPESLFVSMSACVMLALSTNIQRIDSTTPRRLRIYSETTNAFGGKSDLVDYINR